MLDKEEPAEGDAHVESENKQNTNQKEASKEKDSY
jgi:hypothetical protein